VRFDSYLLLVRAGGPGSEAPDKLQNLDVAELPTHWEGPIYLLIPILVIDELDRLKES